MNQNEEPTFLPGYEPQDVLHHLPLPFYVCQVHKPYSLLYANQELLTLLDCQDLAELRAHIGNQVLNLVAFEDVERTRQEVAKQLREKKDRFEHVHSRIVTRRGRIHYAEISGHLVHTPEYGEVFYCLVTVLDQPSASHSIDKDVRDYVVNHIDEALEKRWIQIYYQPVIRTLTGKLCGFEALARWVDPYIGFLSPASFIPALEQTRQIHKLDLFVLKELCQGLRQRLDAKLPCPPVSFNLSRLDFLFLDVFQTIEDTVAAYDLPRDLLHVEVTESTVARDPGPIRRTIERLREAGYEVWVDDFGSGYSSLNILKDCTVDLIKLDMGFLRTFTEKSRQIIASTIDMAKRLGIKTLTEGVETQEQADFLASIGCGRLQGYFFGKPQPLAGALAHIQAQGRGLEMRKWHHYFDVASSVIQQTDLAAALLELAEDEVHFLYTNEAYRQELLLLHSTPQEAEKALNNAKDPATYDTFRESVQNARRSQKPETYFYVDNGSYIRICLEVVLEYNGHTLIRTDIKNITKNREWLEHVRFDQNLRYLYMLFDDIHIVHLDRDTIEPLFLQESPGHDMLFQEQHGIRAFLDTFSSRYIHPDDRSRYLAYCDPATADARLKASPGGRIYDCFRIRDPHGNYNWKEYTATLIPNTDGSQILTTVQSIEFLPQTLQAMHRESGQLPAPVADSETLAALLWNNLQQNSRLCYFWKDKQRRFVGASKAFLACYGFASEKDIIGRTDEEMGWHVDDVPYRTDECNVLQKGHIIAKSPGQCIIRGVLHQIVAYKWPIYYDGQIIGLMGMFLDIDTILQESKNSIKVTYYDAVTGLMNRQGLLDALLRYEEQWQLHGRAYGLVLFGSRSYKRIADSYGETVLGALLRKTAERLRQRAGKDTTLARVTQSMFALIRYTDKGRSLAELARDIAEELENIHEIEGNPITLTIPYGIACADEPGLSSENIYQTALNRLQHHTPPEIEN